MCSDKLFPVMDVFQSHHEADRDLATDAVTYVTDGRINFPLCPLLLFDGGVYPCVLVWGRLLKYYEMRLLIETNQQMYEYIYKYARRN